MQGELELVKGKLCNEDWPSIVCSMTFVQYCLIKTSINKDRYNSGCIKEDIIANT